MGNGHAARHRANVQFSLGDLRHGISEYGELHQETVHIGKNLTNLIVREVIRYRDGLRDLPGAKMMERGGNLIKKLFCNRDHLGTSFGVNRETTDPAAGAPAVDFFDVVVLPRVGKQKARNKSLIISADLLGAHWNPRTIEVLSHRDHKRALLVIGRFDAEDSDAQFLHGALEIGEEAGQVTFIGKHIFAVLFTGFLARLEKDAVSIIDAKIPDEDIPQRELHQAVHGYVNHGTEIRPPCFDIAQHAPFELAFVPLFLEHNSTPFFYEY
jgi:hypothetical protein